MDTLEAFERGEAARQAGAALKVFDWEKAFQILTDRKPEQASAGLKGDYEYTAGVIWQDGKPVSDDYAYLASTWAMPMLILPDGDIPCWVWQSERPHWGPHTMWPNITLIELSQLEDNK